MEKKLSEKQQQLIDTLNKYPNDMIMFNGYMTGGYGIKFDKRTINSLKDRGILFNGKLVK